MQKGFAQVYLLIVLLILGVGGYYYFSKTSNKPVIPQSTSSITPTKAVDETANWTTYTNTQWKYTLKYPSTYRVDGLNMGSAEENLEVLIALTENIKTNVKDYPFFRVWVSNGASTDLVSYASSSYSFNKSNNKLNAKLEKFISGELVGWQYDFSGKIFNTTSREGKTDGKSGFTVDYTGTIKVIFLQNQNNRYIILSANMNPFNQILSTFKFLDKNQSEELMTIKGQILDSNSQPFINPEVTINSLDSSERCNVDTLGNFVCSERVVKGKTYGIYLNKDAKTGFALQYFGGDPGKTLELEVNRAPWTK